MKFRRLGHPVRLAIIASATSGAILAALFVLAVLGFREAEVNAAYEVLEPSLGHAMQEVHERAYHPEIDEVVEVTPELSLAVFTDSGHLIKQVGSIHLEPFLGSQIRKFGGSQSVAMGRRLGTFTVVAAVPWGSREAAIRRLSCTLAILWFPLTLAAASVTWFASRATFLPLAELAQEAEELSEVNLSRRLSSEFTGEYGDFAATLNRFLERLESSVQRQERFIGDAAHELRTPLTVLRGRIETTLLKERPEAEYRHALEIALEEAERLSHLVEVLLQSAVPIDENVSPLDLEAAAERAQARWLDRFASKGVLLELSLAIAFAQMLEPEFDSLMDNLLANALRASPTGTCCRIELKTSLNGSRLTISDEGEGVSAELAPRVFDRFTRGETSRNRELGGFGIGLSVCQRIVEARGGQISLVSETGKGACFAIQLPPP